MQKNLTARILLLNKNYLLSVKSKVLDGRIFLTGKVDEPEEKLKLTKIAWETDGVRSVRNDIKIKEAFNFKQSAKDLLITSQLRTALILNKEIKATNLGVNIKINNNIQDDNPPNNNDDNSFKVSNLLYADDIVLLAQTEVDLQSMLSVVNNPNPISRGLRRF